MATLLQQNNQDDEQQAQQQPVGQPQVVGGGQSSMIATNAVSGSGTGNRSATAGSGRFANLQNYLNANKDFRNDKGTLGEGIKQNIQSEGDKVRQGIQSAQNQFNTAVGQDENLYKNYNQTLNTALQDPNQFVQDDQNVNNFAKLRQGQISFDPNAVAQTVNSVSPSLSNFKNLANQAQTETGRFGLLQKTYGTPTYARGQQRLDQLLLQSSPQQGTDLTKFGQQIGNAVSSEGNKTIEETNARLAAIQNLRQKASTDIVGALGDEASGQGAIGGLVSSLGTRANQTQAEREALFNEARKYLQSFSSGSDVNAVQKTSPQYSEQVKQLLGVPSAKDIASGGDTGLLPLAGIVGEGELNDLINQGLKQGAAATRENVASEDEVARYNALSKLAGKEGSLFKNRSALDNAFSFDKNVFNDVNTREYNKVLDTLKAQYLPNYFSVADPMRGYEVVDKVRASRDSFNKAQADAINKFGRQNVKDNRTLNFDHKIDLYGRSGNYYSDTISNMFRGQTNNGFDVNRQLAGLQTAINENLFTDDSINFLKQQKYIEDNNGIRRVTDENLYDKLKNWTRG